MLQITNLIEGHKIQKECTNLKIHPATKEPFPIISKNNMALIEGLWTELQNRTAEQMFSADLLTPAPVIVYLQLTVPGCLQQAWQAAYALWSFSFHIVRSGKVEEENIVVGETPNHCPTANTAVKHQSLWMH